MDPDSALAVSTPHPSETQGQASAESKESNNAVRQRNSTPLKTHLKPTLVLENSGSVARDHLASERTFLAYVRTSLAIASTGVALVQLFALQSTSSNSNAFARPLGATTVIFALFILLVGVGRYFAIQTALVQNRFPVARVLVAIIAIILCILVVIVFAFLLVGRS